MHEAWEMAAYYLLHWSAQASRLAGVALSTTSVAVVYAVMLELGLNRTDLGKVLLDLLLNSKRLKATLRF